MKNTPDAAAINYLYYTNRAINSGPTNEIFSRPAETDPESKKVIMKTLSNRFETRLNKTQLESRQSAGKSQSRLN